MCPLYCKPEDIGLASGFLGSAKQVAGTIAGQLLSLEGGIPISSSLTKCPRK